MVGVYNFMTYFMKKRKWLTLKEFGEDSISTDLLKSNISSHCFPYIVGAWDHFFFPTPHILPLYLLLGKYKITDVVFYTFFSYQYIARQTSYQAPSKEYCPWDIQEQVRKLCLESFLHHIVETKVN